MIKPDQQKMQQLLSEAITVLCKNGLNYQSHVNVEALIGITLDDDEVFLVSVRETIQSMKAQQMAMASPPYSPSPAHRPKATLNRKRTAQSTAFQTQQHSQQAINVASSDHGVIERLSDSGEPPEKRAVEDSDVIHIKGEQSDDEETNVDQAGANFEDNEQSAEPPDDGGGDGDTYDTSQLEQFVDFATTSQSSDLNQVDSKAAVFANQPAMNQPEPDPTYSMASPSLASSSHHPQMKSSPSRAPQQVGTFYT